MHGQPRPANHAGRPSTIERPSDTDPDRGLLSSIAVTPVQGDKPGVLIASDGALTSAGCDKEATVLRLRPARTSRRRDMSNRTFDEILEAARRGSNPAFTYLYRSLSPRIQSFARARNAPDPDDLVNDCLLKIFTRLQQFEGNEAQFNAWVFKTVRNTLIDQARRRAVRPVEDLVDFTPQSEAPEDPAEAAVGNVQLESLLKHLDVLTGDQRDVVLLRVVADLSINSIAEILHKSPGATKAVQRRAFTALAKALQVRTRPAGDQLASVVH